MEINMRFAFKGIVPEALFKLSPLKFLINFADSTISLTSKNFNQENYIDGCYMAVHQQLQSVYLNSLSICRLTKC
jgi:hypothetical protein